MELIVAAVIVLFLLFLAYDTGNVPGILFIMLLITGCSSSSYRIYNAEGALVEEGCTRESIVKSITDSTKGKTVVAWESGWCAYISCSVATTDDPTPTIKMYAGKMDRGVVSALPNQKGWNGISKSISATRSDMAVKVTGIETHK